MNADELPLELLAWCVLGAWCLLAAMIGVLDARAVRAERRQHGSADDPVQGREHEHGRQDHREEEEQDVGSVERGDHGRMLHPRLVALPPGIPSILERLDRWKD